MAVGNVVALIVAVSLGLFGCIQCQLQTDEKAAILQKARNDYSWGPWGPWGPCTKTCDLAYRFRTRRCYPRLIRKPGEPALPLKRSEDYCFGSKAQTQLCRTRKCYKCIKGRTVYNKCGDRCICSSRGTLTKCTRIRKEFSSMSDTERKRYVKIVKYASTHPSIKHRYDALLTSHKTYFTQGIHQTNQFLPWHRWFLLQYEDLLREVDCRFTVAYWDYVAYAGNPFGTTFKDLWYSGSSGFGGNGVLPDRCVKTGPFRKSIWQLVPSVDPPRCLKRDFFGNPPGEVELALLLGVSHTAFLDFEALLSGSFHDNIHCLIGETMCSFDAAAAPEFFLLHGMVDKIWEDWQKKSHAHRTVHFSTINTPMTVAGTLAKYYLYSSNLPGGKRVEYRPINDTQVTNVYTRLRGYSRKRLQDIPRPGSTPMTKRAIKLFRLSKSKLSRIQKMEAMIKPRVRRRLSPNASALDKKLGFDHKAAEKAA